MRMSNRPIVPISSTSHPDDSWVDYDRSPVSPSSAYVVDSPISVGSVASIPRARHPLARSESEEGSVLSDSSYSRLSVRSPGSLPPLPDPSQYPDPYPYRPPQWPHGTATPALSTTDSSSASTRSSAYTNAAQSGDYGHVHVVGDEEPGVGINKDEVMQLLADAAGTSSSSQSRLPTDQMRWSDLYANSVRSRSSSFGNGRTDNSLEVGSPRLHTSPSFDMNWQSVDERDEIGMTSEDETDDASFIDDDDDDMQDGEEEQPTSAMVIAEEGRGIIVRGEHLPIMQLQVKNGTTHLLIGSSSTPNAVPAFLTNVLPSISYTLLALDISANFLGALPPVLAGCVHLEELNIASNPLRALPVFLSSLTSLRVLIVDSTGISTLPDPLEALDKLHTLSIRRNKMSSLPSWLCLLPSLETLLVDGNPFQGPWKALVEPLLAKTPMTPLYPPSTPMFPLPSASAHSADTDAEDQTDSPWGTDGRFQAAQDEEDTITPARAPHLIRAATSTAQPPKPPTLTRTRTTPNKSYYDKNRNPKSSGVSPVDVQPTSSASNQSAENTSGQGERELRKMKSAGELRRGASNLSAGAHSVSATSSPQRPLMSQYGSSASSSNLLSAGSSPPDVAMSKRFASLGVTSGGMSSPTHRSRPPIENAMWQDASGGDQRQGSSAVPDQVPPPHESWNGSVGGEPMQRHPVSEMRPRHKQEKDKSNRWGFLKKMSMGKMRDSPPSSRPTSTVSRNHTSPSMRPLAGKMTSSAPGLNPTPHISVRISTTGSLMAGSGNPEIVLPTLLGKGSTDALKVSLTPPSLLKKSSMEILKAPLTSSNLLAPSPTPRSTKRRSFLPIDMSPIPIPDASSFVPGMTALNDTDEGDEDQHTTHGPTPIDTSDHLLHREEEKAREARTRALRSVMAYLKDMYDLGLSQVPQPPTQAPTLSMYGGSLEVQANGSRSRRPTIVETGRMPSDASVSSVASTSTRPESSVLSSRGSIRSANGTQTMSIATTDSGGSGAGEERKYKDDKSKRAKIIREIVETERTYVRGLQELVDIYMRPAAEPVSSVTGTQKDTVVPASERKIVFNGIDALFSFHRGSFLPALERAAAPVMRPAEDLVLTDADGQSSLEVARAVANIFLSHAAFMKMYSTYINNFDNSVHRLKSWTSDRNAPAQTPTTSPSSSSGSQLVGLGIAMSAVSAPGVMPDAPMNMNVNVAPLTSSQRKRIKAYLKRCRMNPRHSQLNLEGYLLLPVQRIPRYRLLLEELVRSCPPMYDFMNDPLEQALAEISSLATNMNEGKRESESRRRLVQWQARIRGKFPSPLVQPHRRLIMDGRLHLTRVVRKMTVTFEVIDSQGDASTVAVECLSPELTPRALTGVLCNDLLVLCRDPTEGVDPGSQVDLWAVLRMQTLPQPASIVHGNVLRLVDNKAILYFETPTTSDALNWFRAINLNIPASKAA